MNTGYENENIFNVGIDDTARNHLRTAATWARIIAIIAFASYAVNIITAFLGKKAGGFTGEEVSGLAASASRGSEIISAIIGAVIGIILNIFLLRFGSNTREAMDNLSQGSLETGLNGLRSYFKMSAILLIIVGIFVLLALLLLLAGGGLSRY
jgi:uncharacterized membrane protein YhdT